MNTGADLGGGASATFVGKTKQAFAVYSITFGKLGGGKNEITEEQ